ncbi:MAG: hypothetical protein K2O96_06255 [Lachnospiraceae bacterium]|nr:hypothetical protein [Lachnospiraceae bacterium]
MLKTMVDNQILFVVMGVMAGIGLFSKIVIWFTLKKIVKEAGNMAQSTHKLMKLVKAKFEHACMVSEKVQNVKAFVRKYIYEYRMFGMRIHTWRQLEKQSIWMIGILAILGAGASYYLYGMQDGVLYYGGIGAAGVALMTVVLLSADESYLLNTMQIYMIDYLENFCVPRYAKERKRVKEERRNAYATAEETSDMAGEVESFAPPEELSAGSCKIEDITEDSGEGHEIKEGLAIEIEDAGEIPIQEVKLVESEERRREAAIREILEEFLTQN